jgi:plasmid stabilization system protein ParE
MRLEVTDSAWSSLDALTVFWSEHLTHAAIDARVDELWEALSWLLDHPGAGQVEEYLSSFGMDHRRWIVGDVKVIYRLAPEVLYVTDFFDSRQDPRKMKG